MDNEPSQEILIDAVSAKVTESSDVPSPILNEPGHTEPDPVEPDPVEVEEVEHSSNLPDTEPKYLVFHGIRYRCIDELPAGMVADIMERQISVNEAAEAAEENPMKAFEAMAEMVSMYRTFVEDEQLPALELALRAKKPVIPLRMAMDETRRMLALYFHGEPSPK